MTTSRKRAVNFSKTENRLSIDLVLEKKHNIENKQNDAVVWSTKKETWHEIAIKFNSVCGQHNRTAEDPRKKKATIKREMYITGGGRVSCGGEMLDYEERPAILTSVGLPSIVEELPAITLLQMPSTSVLGRDRFMLIMRCLHFAQNPGENDQRPSDRLFKIRPLVDYFNNKMLETYYPDKNLSLDESMMLWRGRLMQVLDGLIPEKPKLPASPSSSKHVSTKNMPLASGRIPCRR
ncbi:hypothetical protein ILUMI_05733, partial [Ignelater luminosus]